jgi:hypothetical protein
MKNSLSKNVLLGTLFFLAASPFAARAQNYSITWHKIAGGGGASSGGQYAVTGTVGQHDAGGPLTGGTYSVTGGFWSFISVVPTTGAPTLTITRSGGSVIISWPNTGSYTLQQNGNLAAPASWAASGYSVTTADGTNSVTVTPAGGSLFFRLTGQ